MKKFKEWFLIDPMRPLIKTLSHECILCVRKLDRTYKIEGSDKPLMEQYFEFELTNGNIARFGMWLVKDVCDNWHLMNNDGYDKHKDDEI